MTGISSLALPLLHRIDPERAHRIALAGIGLGLAGKAREPDDPALRVAALGLDFPNPIGLAAGFDKDAAVLGSLLRLGFGFVEAGTVTLRAQPGNPRPRVFRLTEDRAAINRMGFNNQGIHCFRDRLARLQDRRGPIGVNLGINKDAVDPERDFAALATALAPLADYLVINVSSPNTPGLRDLQAEARLRAIIAAIDEAVPKRPPLLVKVAPDLAQEGLEAVVETAVSSGVQGLIVSNTTLSRPPGLRSPRRDEAGGLSGAPLFPLSTAMLARACRLARGRLVLIAVGGVASGADALAKIEAGASLVQLYTAFIYEGPSLIGRIKRELAAALRARGFRQVAEAVGTGAARMAEAA